MTIQDDANVKVSTETNEVCLENKNGNVTKGLMVIKQDFTYTHL